MRTDGNHVIEFPVQRLPDDPEQAKLLGLYAQRQDGRWMQRVKVLGGLLTAEQWHALSRLAEVYTPGTPLHLTSRQDIELHDLKAEDVPAIQKLLSEVGLTTVGACGDTLRNITICPCSGVHQDSVDLFPLAWAVRRMLEKAEYIFSLPRKFKITMACGENCGQPWINDVGLVARHKHGQWGFRVIMGGSLGARPSTGIEIYDWVPAGEILPLAAAAVRTFNEHGDRENRKKARLRHFREKIGDLPFTCAIKQRFRELCEQESWPEIELRTNNNGLNEQVRLTFANGDVSPEAAHSLEQLTEMDDLEVRIANHHRILVLGTSEDQLRERISTFPALAEAARQQPAIIACPGNRWCKKGLVNTNAVADMLRSHTDALDPDTTVCISGCPNGCVHTAVADIGLSGRLVSKNGEKEDAYNFFTGGGMGRTNKLAKCTRQKLSAAQIIDIISKAETY